MKTELAIAKLREYARLNYDVGGHWVYETFNDGDYLRTYLDCNAVLKTAKQSIREFWETFNEMEIEYNA